MAWPSAHPTPETREAAIFEAYAVGVRLSLIDGVTTGLLGIARLFAKTHGDATALQSKLDRIKMLAMGGAAVAGTGLFGLHMLGKTLPYAREYAHQLAQMNVAGMKQAEIARAINAAWTAGKAVPTSTAAENLAAVRELRMVFGNTNDAIANMPAVQQLQAILRNTKGSGSQDEAYTVAKALEMKGAVRTPGEFRVEADMMAKAIVASGGKVGAQDFLSAFKYGRSATLGWDRAFTYTILPTLIQEMKSSGGSSGVGGPGNALMSVYDKVIGGKIAQKDIPIWLQLGLLDPSKIVYTKTHSAKGVLPEAVTGWAQFQQNPYAWTQNVLMKAMREHGITDPAKQQMYLGRLGGTRTAGFMLQQMGMQGWKFERDQKLIHGAQGLGAYKTLLKTDPEMAMLALHKQWQNLLAIIGFQIMPTLISGALTLINILRPMAHFAKEHPTITKALVLGFAALSGLMVVGGTIMMLAAAFGAIGLVAPLAVAAVSGVTGAVVAVGGAILAAVGWPVLLVVGGLAAVGLAIFGLVKTVDKWSPMLKSAFKLIGNAIAGFVNFLHSLLPSIPAFPGTPGGAPLKAYPKTHGLPGSPNATGRHPLRQWWGQLNHKSAFHSSTGPGGQSQSPYVPTGSVARAVQVNSTINLDGREVAQAVTHHQVREAGRAQSGNSGFDPGLGLTPSGLGYAV